MPTPTHFDSAYNVGDSVYIMTDTGAGALVVLTAINFRVGFNPLFFVAATDFIYTTDLLAIGGLTYQERAQQYCFASKADMKTYVDTLP